METIIDSWLLFLTAVHAVQFAMLWRVVGRIQAAKKEGEG